MDDVLGSLVTLIGADLTGFQSGMSTVRTGMTGLASDMTSWGKNLTAGITLPIIGFLGAAVKAAADNETALAQLDAVLKSTSATTGDYSTSTEVSSKKLASLQKQLDQASSHLNDLQLIWDSTKKHTEAATLALEHAKEKVGQLKDEISQGSQTITTFSAVTHMARSQLIDMAIGFSETTRFSKDAVIGAESLLLTFRHIGKDVFPDVTQTVLDMSQALGQDLKSSAIQLGKALEDPEKGITALQRVGVVFSASQKAQIQDFLKTGQLAKAQGVILKELEKEFGGSAKAAGKTFAGQLDILNHNFTDFQENIGAVIIPVLEEFMTTLSGVVEGLNELDPSVLRMGIAAAIAVAAIGPILGILGGLATVLGFVLSPIGLLIAGIAALGIAFVTNFGGIRDATMPIIRDFIALLGDIWAKVKPGLDMLAAWFTKEVLPKVVDFIKNVVLPGIDNLIRDLKKIWDDIAPKLLAFEAWFLKDGLPKVGQAFTDFGNNVIKPVTSILQDLWTLVEPYLTKLGDWFLATVLPKINDAVNWFKDNVIKPATEAVKAIWNDTGPLLDAFAAWFHKNLPIIKDLFDSYIGGIVQQVSDLTSKIQAMLLLLGGHVQINPNLQVQEGVGNGANINTGNTPMDILQAATGGGRATGGGVMRGTSYLIGERGPELFTPGANGFITPNSALGGAGGYNGPDTIHVVLEGDGFVQHIYAGVAEAYRAGNAARGRNG